MAKAKPLNDNSPRTYQWVTDGGPCEAQSVPSYREILVEVTGDLEGKSVTIFGSLAPGDDMPLLAFTKVSPYLATVPAVNHVRPSTEAKGVTITIRGIQ